MGNAAERGVGGAARAGPKLPPARRADTEPGQGQDLAALSLPLGTLSMLLPPVSALELVWQAVELLSTEPNFMLPLFAFCIFLHNKF